jgi:protein-ribulosamine 3-kinase
MPDWSSIAKQLEPSGLTLLQDAAPIPVSGGDISAAWRCATESDNIFIKTGPSSAADMFAAEADGLTELAATGVIRVPEVHAVGETDDGVFLALEWLQLESPDSAIEQQLGEQLACLHETTREKFGWHRDNTIGLTLQRNTQTNSWVEFFREHRLGFQLKLAADNGHTGALQERGAQLLKRLPVYFDKTEPALLHGDLWSGNYAGCQGQAVIFDPALYYGDREADIAMTRLFGGFGDNFYRAYESRWPQTDGYWERQNVYQLYHVLNHLNLFGSSYMARAISLLDEVL